MALSATQRRAVQREAAQVRRDAAPSPGGGPGTVASAKRSSASTKRWAKDSGYKPRSTATLKRTPITRTRSMDSVRKASSASNRRWAATSGYKPRSDAEIARTPIRARPKQPVSVRTAGTGALGAVGKAGRTLGMTLGAVGASVLTNNPADTVGKAAGQAKDAAKGLAVAGALVPYTLAYPINRALGNNPSDNLVGVGKAEGGGSDSPGELASRLIKGEGERISKTYGPAYRGEKGAFSKLKKQVDKEGILTPLADVATVVAPTNFALGVGARSGKLGTVAKAATTTRPGVRMTGFGDAAVKPGRVRRTPIGAAAGATHDAARRGAQRVAVKRSEKAGKELPSRRRLLEDGEVTPISNVRVARNLRFRVAQHVTRGNTAARLRTKEYVTGSKGYVQAVRQVPKELRDLPEIAHQLGIRSAANAKTIIPMRLAEIERETAAAMRPGAPPEARAALAEKGTEAARLRELLANPKVFDRPDVRAAVEGSLKAKLAGVNTREGLSPERAAEGRAGLAGGTVGVKRASDMNREIKVERNRARIEANDVVIAAKAEHVKARAAAARTLPAARAELAHAKGRAEVLSRNVTGKNTLGPKDAKYAAGGHGVRQAEQKLAVAQAAAGEKLSLAAANVKAARDARTALNKTPIKKHRETPSQYAARVDAKFEELGLARPEYSTSKYAEFEDDLHVKGPGAAVRGSNPMRHKREGVNYRLGRQGHQYETAAASQRAAIERGAAIQAEQNMLKDLGIYFESADEAKAFMRGMGLSGKDVDIIQPPHGVVRKDMASKGELEGDGPRGGGKSKDQGDTVSARGVFVVDKAVKAELDALGQPVSAPSKILRMLSYGPQGALLALSPSWFVFQRVNDVVAATAGGSIAQTRKLDAAIKAMDPEDQHLTRMMSGGSVSSDFLTPRAGATLGRMHRVLDENPTYKAALNSDRPAYNLLFKGLHDVPTALLRADASMTGGFRDRQFLASLMKQAAKMDPDVKTAYSGFAPLGHALKTGDADLIKRLLNDPKYHKAREDAAVSLNRIMGDWHNYTAAEQKFKSLFAFYGFLRYATRMALYTLPVDHPQVGLLVYNLGRMGAQDAKAIVGPDMPWGIGALYNKDGTFAMDLTRANPLTGPLVSMTKTEHVWQLGTPLISIMTSVALGQNIGLSDSATGYVRQMTAKGDPNNHTLDRATKLRIFGDQVMGLLTPYKVWKNWDSRRQTSDSLAWDRKIAWSESESGEAKIRARNESRGKGGIRSVGENLLPMAFPDDKNMKWIGEQATAGREKRAAETRLKAAKRKGAQGLGAARHEAGVIREQVKAEVEALQPKELQEIRAEAARIRAELGQTP